MNCTENLKKKPLKQLEIQPKMEWYIRGEQEGTLNIYMYNALCDDGFPWREVSHEAVCYNVSS